jgi:ElaB/YqjD/DUF883 family membrane-anchored ribosome-binding protein
MDSIITFLKEPFAWGLALGLLFFCLSAWAHFKTKRELRRYKKLLSDKLELEARQYEVIRKEKDAATKENEHLRVRVQQLMEKPEQKITRDLETLTRAEKRMVLQAPGFAAAWETAKAQAAEELSAEDSGKSLPKRLFNRLFGNSSPRDLDARLLTETSVTSTPEAPATESTPDAAKTPAA